MKEIYKILADLTDDFFKYAFVLIPDDLHAEQLVIDSVSAFLLQDGRNIVSDETRFLHMRKSEVTDEDFSLKNWCLKKILFHLYTIGVRRSQQLKEQSVSSSLSESEFYSLEAKVRFILWMRHSSFFSNDEISQILRMEKTHIIQYLHNGKYLMKSQGKKRIKGEIKESP